MLGYDFSDAESFLSLTCEGFSFFFFFTFKFEKEEIYSGLLCFHIVGRFFLATLTAHIEAIRIFFSEELDIRHLLNNPEAYGE